MKTFYSLNEFLKSKTSGKKFIMTIGVFDGVHSAHQKIINTLIKKAKKNKLSTLFITFDPHPVKILNKAIKVPMLISLKHRLDLIAKMGVENTVVLRFDRKLARMSARKFIEKIIKNITINEIVVGSKFYFGKNKSGSEKKLKKFSKDYGYKTCVVKAKRYSGKVISSTWIRKLIIKGDLGKASKLLLRPVSVLGTVVKGYRRGRFIGFPTANIDPHHEAIPPPGVYAVKARLANKTYNGILNIGTRPTFKTHRKEDLEPTIEVHIFKFHRNIYSKDLEIAFVKKLRREKRFANMKLLRKQIEEDIGKARKILR